ncbi:hypothetical protein ACOBQJ_10190 [Pelotomaculum propionicicum]|uniref:hypothetical protein n=1 Tax=Pelotomaculum propionicicum TaxID=258475 RepID=UPI003B7E5D06
MLSTLQAQSISGKSAGERLSSAAAANSLVIRRKIRIKVAVSPILETNGFTLSDIANNGAVISIDENKLTTAFP